MQCPEAIEMQSQGIFDAWSSIERTVISLSTVCGQIIVFNFAHIGKYSTRRMCNSFPFENMVRFIASKAAAVIVIDK